MNKLSKAQKYELLSLGLNDEQLSQCESILQTIPAVPEIKKANQIIQLLGKVQNLLDEIEANDPRSFDVINMLLDKKPDLKLKPLLEVQGAVKGFVEQEKGVFSYTWDSNSQKAVTSVTTPNSKNHHRFEALTSLWRSWGRDVLLSRSSEFTSLLTICIEGSYSEKAANRTYTNYQRYYRGKSVDVDEVIDTNQPENEVKYEVVYKKNSDGVSRTETQTYNLPNLDDSQIQDQLTALKKQRD